MKFFTSYYDNIEYIKEKYPEAILISISGGISKEIKDKIDFWDNRFAPSLSIYNEYKDNLDEKLYIKRFNEEILKNRDINQILYSWSLSFGQEKKYILLCYEKPNDFCHRHLVAEAIEKKYDIKIEELK